MTPDVWQAYLINASRIPNLETAAVRQLYIDGMEVDAISEACRIDEWRVRDCILGFR